MPRLTKKLVEARVDNAYSLGKDTGYHQGKADAERRMAENSRPTPEDRLASRKAIEALIEMAKHQASLAESLARLTLGQQGNL